MVFAIPNWEDGNTKTNAVFSKEIIVKQTNRSPKKSPQKKSSPQEKGTVNVISEKSKLINKGKKKQLINQKQNKNRQINISNNKVQLVSLQKLESVSPSAVEQESDNVCDIKEQSKTNKQRTKKSRKVKQERDNSDSSFKGTNLDTDKLDEVLLNAKKTKFNEALKKDDVEDILFNEDKSPQVNTKKALKLEVTHQNHPILKSNGIENKTSNNRNKTKSRVLNKKQEKTINNTIVKAKNNSLIKPVIDKVFKEQPTNDFKEKNNYKPAPIEPEENIEHQVVNDKQTRKDKKKDKLKQILKAESNRNPIHLNGNKLRERMLDRLKSAQFRFLNEKLYTSSGSEASQLFQNDPTAFLNYHEGYQQQVKKWPVNPLDVIVKRIQKMPKRHLIADMGCGEAALAKRVPHTVRSFDLVATAPGVEVCDMAHTPLLTGSVDAVVYCLALMGTELTTYLIEANRVLKTGGHLLIAEVESRFTDVNAFAKEVSRLGFKLQQLNSEHEVFFFMEFVKNQEPPVKKSKLPVLTLKPCIYKRR